jgi:spore coat protein U-like protein
MLDVTEFSWYATNYIVQSEEDRVLILGNTAPIWSARALEFAGNVSLVTHIDALNTQFLRSTETSTFVSGVEQSVKAGLHGASREAMQVNKYLAPSYLLRVDINLPKFWGKASNKQVTFTFGNTVLP